MALTAETIAKINLRAQRINDEQARKAAKDEWSKDRFEAHETKIREELENLNQQIAGDAELQKSLSVVLPKKDGYGTFYDSGRSHSCTGLPISHALNQIAVMTRAGIEILHKSFGFKRDHDHMITNLIETVFKPLDLAKANVDELFPKTKFPVDELPNAILNAVLQSPNKK